MVFVTSYSATFATIFTFTVDWATYNYNRAALGSGSNSYTSISIIVPANSTYSVNVGTLNAWIELR